MSRHSVVAAVTLTARDDVGDCVDVTFDPRVDCGSEEERQALRIAIESSLQQGMALVHKCVAVHSCCLASCSGPLLGFPVQGVTVRVHKLTRNEDTPLPLLCRALAQAIHKVVSVNSYTNSHCNLVL